MTEYIIQIMCQKIVSGGQTGVDRGALDACLKLKFPNGGWCPKGRIAEDGVIDLKYKLRETDENDYSQRTRKNVEDSDGTLIITNDNIKGGTKITLMFTGKLNKPTFLASNKNINNSWLIDEIIQWMKEFSIAVLNVAGPRKSEWENGYQYSFDIIFNLILKLGKNKTGAKPVTNITDFKK